MFHDTTFRVIACSAPWSWVVTSDHLLRLSHRPHGEEQSPGTPVARVRRGVKEVRYLSCRGGVCSRVRPGGVIRFVNPIATFGGGLRDPFRTQRPTRRDESAVVHWLSAVEQVTYESLVRLRRASPRSMRAVRAAHRVGRKDAKRLRRSPAREVQGHLLVHRRFVPMPVRRRHPEPTRLAPPELRSALSTARCPLDVEEMRGNGLYFSRR